MKESILFSTLYYFLLSSLVLNVQSIQAQDTIKLERLKSILESSNNPEDHYKALDSLSWDYRVIDLDTAFYYHGMMNQLLIDHPDELRKINYYTRTGLLKRYLGQLDSSLHYYQKSLDYHLDKNNPDESAQIQYAIGRIYTMQMKLDQAMEISLLAADNFETAENKIGQIRIANLIGGILKDSERMEDAKAYFLKGIQLAEDINNPYEASHLYSNLAGNYHKLNEFDQALEYYQKVLEYDKSVGMSWGIAYQHQNIGDIYSDQKLYSKAIKEYEKSLAIKKQLKHEEEVTKVEGILGQAKVFNGQHAEGLRLLESSLRKSKDNGWNVLYKDQLQYFSQALIESGQYKKASQTLVQYNHISDSLWNANLNSQMNDLHTKYETVEKEKEIKLLNADNEVKEIQLKSARLRNLTFGIASLIFGGLLFILYRLYKKVAIQNEEKDILLKEIHHRVKNNLQVVSSLLAIQSRSIKDEKVKSAIKDGRNRVKSMALIHQNLYRKDNLTGIVMKDYLNKLSQDLVKTYQVSAGKIDIITKIDDLNLDVESVVPIGLIVNELLTNSLKHAFPNDASGAITLSLKELNQRLILKVIDNGKGIEENSLELDDDSSFGHSLIQAFQRKLDAEFSIKNENGTLAELVINNYKKAG